MNQIAYELVELNKLNWNQNIENIIPDLMFKSEYVELLSQSFKFKINYIVIKQSGNINLVAIVFFKKNRIVFADNYTYQPLWINPSISERKQSGILSFFIKHIIKNFESVKFKLNPLLMDIRPFKWAGFSVEPKYTYFRYLNTPIHKNINARLKRGKIEILDVLVDKPTWSDININIDFLKTLKFNKRKIENYSRFLKDLKESGFLKSFSIISEGETIYSFLVLVDMFSKKAYTLMINGSTRNQEYFHALIYKKIIEWADEKSIEIIDLCGANMEGISQFKSYFNPQLKQYFIVRYGFFQKVISIMTMILNKF
jgi:hypothetical protein